MLKIGEIKYIDIENKEVRVLVHGVYSLNLEPKQYPVAILTTPIPLYEQNGFYNKLYVGQKLLCDFIQEDFNTPVIVSFITAKNDINKDIFQKNILEITTNKSKGIRLIEDGENIKSEFDGDINLSLTEQYKNLLKHLNDIKEMFISFIEKYNTHTHNTIDVNGIKGKAFAIGDSPSYNGLSLPEYDALILGAPTLELKIYYQNEKILAQNAINNDINSVSAGQLESLIESLNIIFQKK